MQGCHFFEATGKYTDPFVLDETLTFFTSHYLCPPRCINEHPDLEIFNRDGINNFKWKNVQAICRGRLYLLHVPHWKLIENITRKDEVKYAAIYAIYDYSFL